MLPSPSYRHASAASGCVGQHTNESDGSGPHKHQQHYNENVLLDSTQVLLQHLLKPWLHAGCVFDTSVLCKRLHAARLVAALAAAGLSTVQLVMVPE